MFYGFVKTVSFERGFGFIEQNGGPDVYFHATNMQPGEFDRLIPNQPVMFELAKRNPDEKPSEKKGPRATVIKLIERMPGGILAAPPLAMAAKHHPKARRRKATWKRPIDLSAPRNRPPDAEGDPS